MDDCFLHLDDLLELSLPLVGFMCLKQTHFFIFSIIPCFIIICPLEASLASMFLSYIWINFFNHPDW
jgi:hypothetical protein